MFRHAKKKKRQENRIYNKEQSQSIEDPERKQIMKLLYANVKTATKTKFHMVRMVEESRRKRSLFTEDVSEDCRR